MSMSADEIKAMLDHLAVTDPARFEALKRAYAGSLAATAAAAAATPEIEVPQWKHGSVDALGVIDSHVCVYKGHALRMQRNPDRSWSASIDGSPVELNAATSNELTLLLVPVVDALPPK